LMPIFCHSLYLVASLPLAYWSLTHRYPMTSLYKSRCYAEKVEGISDRRRRQVQWTRRAYAALVTFHSRLPDCQGPRDETEFFHLFHRFSCFFPLTNLQLPSTSCYIFQDISPPVRTANQINPKLPDCSLTGLE
jgi:hypothetical protein